MIGRRRAGAAAGREWSTTMGARVSGAKPLWASRSPEPPAGAAGRGGAGENPTGGRLPDRS